MVVGILKGLGKISVARRENSWVQAFVLFFLPTAERRNEDQQAAEFQQLEADAKFMVSAQGITTGTKAQLSQNTSDVFIY